jgi:hypothetical protein
MTTLSVSPTAVCGGKQTNDEEGQGTVLLRDVENVVRSAGRQGASVGDGNDGDDFSRGHWRGDYGHGRLGATSAAHAQRRAIPVGNGICC